MENSLAGSRGGEPSDGILIGSGVSVMLLGFIAVSAVHRRRWPNDQLDYYRLDALSSPAIPHFELTPVGKVDHARPTSRFSLRRQSSQ